MDRYKRHDKEQLTSTAAKFAHSSRRACAEDRVDRLLTLTAIETRIYRTRHVVWKHTNKYTIKTVPHVGKLFTYLFIYLLNKLNI